ncbi:MAG: glycosyltransferase [Bacteroidetes bacterium]|nr:glycosyltransferase [Bacteroidota bacterium]
MISIIVITYNRSGLLAKTVRSILAQTYRKFELIVVNDGSTDDTVEILESIGDVRINHVNEGKIGNLSKLRNIGIKKASFEYIAFCDDDDLWVENKLEVQLKYTKDHKFICSNAAVIDENDKVIKENYFDLIKENFIIDKKYLLQDGNSILTSSLLVEKKILTENNILFDEIFITNYCEDYELFLRLSEHSGFLFINENLVLKRLHSSVSGGYENNLIMLNSSVSILKSYVGKESKQTDKYAIEGILGFKQLMVTVSFKLSRSRGFRELKNYLIYLSDPSVLNVFLKRKLIRKIAKTIGLRN